MKDLIKKIVERNLDIKINNHTRTNQSTIAKCVFYNLLKLKYDHSHRVSIVVKYTGRTRAIYKNYDKIHSDYMWKEYVDYYELCKKELIRELEVEFEEIN